MNAMEKLAWMNLTVCLVAIAVATALIPWLGSAAASAFALLGIIALGGLFLRRQGENVVVDERDREIATRASRVSFGITWMTFVCAVMAATLWSNYTGVHAVSTAILNWLLWIQFAVMYGSHGFVSIVLYRKQAHAA